ncbi:hypothetical protein EYF80_011024 [Liparis tanakae]|uniref:Uncharacterized protein n=1 Tax=Liparis tanakae TaxID=230148 RepID=A0A4Z2IMZ8_9TELE|nr:hypothetical protein EYF80_011024 [Liparis tanakae]
MVHNAFAVNVLVKPNFDADLIGRLRLKIVSESEAPPLVPCSAPLSSAPLSSAPLSSAPLSSAPLSSAPLSSAPRPHASCVMPRVPAACAPALAATFPDAFAPHPGAKTSESPSSSPVDYVFMQRVKLHSRTPGGTPHEKR